MVFKFNLKDRVRDTVCGFEGIVDSRTQWMNGCIRYGVQPTTLDKDGEVRKGAVFDEQQLELVQSSEAPAANPGGGPQRDPRSPVRD